MSQIGESDGAGLPPPPPRHGRAAEGAVGVEKSVSKWDKVRSRGRGGENRPVTDRKRVCTTTHFIDRNKSSDTLTWLDSHISDQIFGVESLAEKHVASQGRNQILSKKCPTMLRQVVTKGEG